MQTFTDPASGRQYTVDPATGQSQWLDTPPAPPTPPMPPAQGGFAYGTGQPPQPAKRGGKALKVVGGVVGVLVLLGIAGSCAGDSGGTATTASDTSAAPASSSAPGGPTAAGSSSVGKPAAKSPEVAPVGPKIGTPVRDGKFEFTVTGTKTVKKIGSDPLSTTAQGQFLLVSVTVRNIGNKAQMFDASSQKLFDTKGREYSADGGASIYLKDSNSFINDINPGNSVKGVVVFDIPAGTVLDRIKLHDSMFSGGVDVKLTK